MAKHTPGPWQANGQSIDAGCTHICFVDTADCNGGLGEGEGEANAKLMAASPDLLEAAKLGLVFALAKWGNDEAAAPAFAKIRAAIAAATPD